MTRSTTRREAFAFSPTCEPTCYKASGEALLLPWEPGRVAIELEKQLGIPLALQAHKVGGVGRWCLNGHLSRSRSWYRVTNQTSAIVRARLTRTLLSLSFLIVLFRATNDPFLRNLDSVLKEKLSTWLGPAYLELRRLTWDSPASVLAKVAEHEVRRNGIFDLHYTCDCLLNWH